jgi:hypothetical protein
LKHTRPYNPYEKQKLEQKLAALPPAAKISWWKIAIAFCVMLASGAHIYYYDDSDWSLISKFLVVLSPIVIWVITSFYFEKRKSDSKEKSFLENLLSTNEVSVFNLEINRATKLGESEDEGTMYLIEQKNGRSIWLYDFVYELEEKTSLSEFIEVYTDQDLFSIFGLVAREEGKTISCSFISNKDKWDYFAKNGWPNHLEVSNKSFDALMLELQYNT